MAHDLARLSSAAGALLLLGSCKDTGGEAVEPGPSYAEHFTAVSLDPDASPAVKIAVRACVGLMNRELGGSAYVQMLDQDSIWLDELGLVPEQVLGTDAFLDACAAERPRCVRYSYAEQKHLLPNILTAGAALGVMPLDEGLDVACDEVAFDARVEFAARDTPLEATRYVFETFVEDTDGFAMLNPGYETDAEDPSDPPITADPRTPMVDLVFSERLFTTFLINGCIADHPESELLSEIVNSGRWPTPLAVYGYNNSWLVQGYLFEAQTRCLDSRNMGAVPTEVGNLSFFSTRRPPTEQGELAQSPREAVSWDAEKTYIAFVVGDGDNVRFMMSTRNVWLDQRKAACAADASLCEPITWSMSPQLPRLAPDVIAWYYEGAAETGRDYFTLPPSGSLYAYPSALAPAEQDKFVTATEDDARVLDVSTTVHWDWFEDWDIARGEFLPKYTRNGVIQGIIPVNVPYLVDAFPDWPEDRFFEVMQGDGGQLVVFRPRQWRGIDDSDEFHLTPEGMVSEIAGYPPGTVAAIYMTSDGGLSLENSVLALIPMLPAHVELVSTDTAARLAMESSR